MTKQYGRVVRGPIPIGLLLVWGFAGALFGLTAQAQQPTVEAQQPAVEAQPSEGFVLLRNGNVLRGTIRPAEGGYLVAIKGGRLLVRAEEVEFCCRTLEEAYQQKRSFVQPGDVRAHLDLAGWCQRNGLVGCAARELAEVKALAPEHPMIPLVQRRIEMSLCPPKRARRPEGEAKDPAPSFEELDRLVRRMPPRSVETFTQTIQPLLMNHCSAAGCHGPETESRFRLMRSPSSRHPSRRLTQRNLHSALEWIDRGDPAASELLSAPIRPHGSAGDAIFTEQHVDQYKQIVDWVYHVASGDTGVETVSHDGPMQESPGKDGMLQTAAPAVYTAPVASPEGVSAAGHEEMVPRGTVPVGSAVPPRAPAKGGGPSASPIQQLQPKLSPLGAIERGAASSGYVPVDPFDAEVFNQRFFPR